MRGILIIFLLFISMVAVAQRGQQLRPIYSDGTSFKNKGWFVAPGVTTMLPLDRRENLTLFNTEVDGLDTLYSGDFRRKGRIGAYLEAGRHHFITDRVLLHHIDYGVHFKMLRGVERFEGLANTGAGYAMAGYEGKFSESFVGAFFNASNIMQLTNNKWIQNSLGVNIDYRIITRGYIDGPSYREPWEFPNSLLGQVHYKIGFGWKPDPGIMIMPMLETPILTAYPFDGFKSTLPYYAGRFRPIILTLRIQWLNKKESRECENQPGKMSTQVNQEKPGKHGKDSLWGDDAKKMKHKKGKK